MFQILRLILFIMVSLVVFPNICFSIELKEKGTGIDKRLLLENEFLKITLFPAKGGRIESMIDKRRGFEIVPGGTGMLLDMFSIQSYPGEMMNESYEYAVAHQSEEMVGVKLWRKATGRGGIDVNIKDILIEKTVILRKESPYLEADYKFINKGDDDKTFVFWSQTFCVSGHGHEGDIFLRPGVSGISKIPYPGGKGDPEVLTNPSAGWFANVDPEENFGTLVLIDHNYLRWIYNCVPASTIEWLSDTVMLSPGNEWNTKIVIAPFSGFSNLTHAGKNLLVDTFVKREKGKIILTHLLSAFQKEIINSKIKIDVILDQRTRLTEYSNLKVPELTFEQKTFTQKMKDPAPEKQMLLKVSFLTKDSEEEWYITIPDTQGEINLVNGLRPRPSKIKHFPKQEKLEIIKDDKLNLLFLTSPGFSAYNLKGIEELIKPGGVKWSYYSSREFVNAREIFLDYFPSNYKTLFSFDAIIFAGIGSELLEDYTKAMIKDYLFAGGSILVLGGPMAMNGWTGEGNPLSGTLPAGNPGPFQIIRLNSPEVLHPVESKLGNGINWNFKPVVRYVHNLKISDDVKVLLTADKKPVMVERKAGKGRIIVFMGTSMGDDENAFWKWKDWTRLLLTVLKGEL